MSCFESFGSHGKHFVKEFLQEPARRAGPASKLIEDQVLQGMHIRKSLRDKLKSTQHKLSPSYLSFTVWLCSAVVNNSKLSSEHLCNDRDCAGCSSIT